MKPYNKRRFSSSTWMLMISMMTFFYMNNTYADDHHFDEAQVQFNNGQAAIDNKEWTRAVTYFSEAIKLRSHFVEAYFQRAKAYEEQKLYKNALSDLTKIIEIDPLNSEGYSRRSYIYLCLHNPEKTIVDCKKVIEIIDKNTVAVYRNLGLALMARKDFEDAYKCFDKCIMLDSSDPVGYYYCATANILLGDVQNAITDITEAIRLDPKKAEYFYILGNSHSKNDDLEKAIKNYNSAIELDPKHIAAYYERSATYKKQGNLQQAEKDMRQALLLQSKKENPEKEKSMYFSATEEEIREFQAQVQADKELKRILTRESSSFHGDADEADTEFKQDKFAVQKNDWPSAVRHFSKAIDSKPRFIAAYMLRANAFREQKMHDKALLDIDKALEIDPNNTELFGSRCFVHMEMGKADEAIADCEKAIQIDKNNVMMHLQCGCIYYFMKRDAQRALDYTTKSINLGGDHHAYGLHAMVLYELGKTKEAYVDLDVASRMAPNDPFIPFAQGVIRLRENDLDLAMEYFNKAIAIDPTYADAYKWRAKAYRKKGDVRKSQEDMKKAADLNPSSGSWIWDGLDPKDSSDYFSKPQWQSK